MPLEDEEAFFDDPVSVTANPLAHGSRDVGEIQRNDLGTLFPVKSDQRQISSVMYTPQRESFVHISPVKLANSDDERSPPLPNRPRLQICRAAVAFRTGQISQRSKR